MTCSKGGPPLAAVTPGLSVRAAGPSNGWRLGRAWRLSVDTGGWTVSVGYFCLQVFKKIKLSCETVLKLSKFKKILLCYLNSLF